MPKSVELTKPRTLDNTTCSINKGKMGNYTPKFGGMISIMEEVQNLIKNMIRNWKIGKFFSDRYEYTLISI